MFIIAICGASGSGKSRFSQNLQKKLIDYNVKCEILSTDSFYKDYDSYSVEQKQDFKDDNLDYDNPQLMDRELLLEVFNDIKLGKNVKIPIYSFDTYKREKNKYREIENNVNVIILEGIFTLSFEELLKLYDLSIFIDTPENICLGRRLVRNSMARKGPFGDFSIEREFNYYKRFTMPFFRKNRHKMMYNADFIVNGMKDNYNIIYKMIYGILKND
jgi:uridine kinase